MINKYARDIGDIDRFADPEERWRRQNLEWEMRLQTASWCAARRFGGRCLGRKVHDPHFPSACWGDLVEFAACPKYQSIERRKCP